jgi:hypothetical protein
MGHDAIAYFSLRKYATPESETNLFFRQCNRVVMIFRIFYFPDVNRLTAGDHYPLTQEALNLIQRPRFTVQA